MRFLHRATSLDLYSTREREREREDERQRSMTPGPSHLQVSRTLTTTSSSVYASSDYAPSPGPSMLTTRSAHHSRSGSLASKLTRVMAPFTLSRRGMSSGPTHRGITAADISGPVGMPATPEGWCVDEFGVAGDSTPRADPSISGESHCEEHCNMHAYE